MSGYVPIGTLPDGQRVGAAIVGRYPQLIWGPLLDAQIERERADGPRWHGVRVASDLARRRAYLRRFGMVVNHYLEFGDERRPIDMERSLGCPAGWLATPGEAPEPPSSLIGADEVRSPAEGSDASSVVATALRGARRASSSQRTGRRVACDASPSPAS